MNQIMKNIWSNFFVSILIMLFVASNSWAQQSANVSVSVSKLSLTGKTVYQYTVVNNSSQRIVGFSLGSDYAHGISELTTYPENWSADTGIANGTVLSPVKWSPMLITTEESPAFEIQWRNDGSADISPGQTLTGFSVSVLGQASQYMTTHWTAIMGNATAASGLLTQSGSVRIGASIASVVPQGSDMYSVKIDISNTGSSAGNVTISNLIFRTLAGSGGVSLVSPSTPITVGNIAAGAKTTITLLVTAAAGVSKFSIAEQGSVKEQSGTTYAFSSSQVVYTKQ